MAFATIPVAILVAYCVYSMNAFSLIASKCSHLARVNKNVFTINRYNGLKMQMGHSHDHHHSTSSMNISPDAKQKSSIPFFAQPSARVLFVVGAVFAMNAIIRKKLTKVDAIIFAGFTGALSVFDVCKQSVKSWISRVQGFREGIRPNAIPINRDLAILSIAINIILSCIKFVGGIAFHSAVLVADAGHSLSDLFSDFITLWAVQVSRLPADNDHPYGHVKFESVASLFLSLTLIATGLSVGYWSYAKMSTVLQATLGTASHIVASTATALHHGHIGHAHLSVAGGHLILPAWPALVLAGISIASKEWLYRITKRVGETINSQLLIANAWHHRSDAFSSLLALASIAISMFIPGFAVAESAAGILIAGMICSTGFKVFIESIRQLTDAVDEKITAQVASLLLSKKIEGIRDVKMVRARSVGSGSLVDLTILTDKQLSSSAAQALAERTRWAIMQEVPTVLDVFVRQCPQLIDPPQRSSAQEVEQDVRQTTRLTTSSIPLSPLPTTPPQITVSSSKPLFTPPIETGSSTSTSTHPSAARAAAARAATRGETLVTRFCQEYNRDVTRNEIYTVYVLKLAEDKYYVGLTQNLAERLTRHASRSSTQWTQRYRVESLIDVIQPADEYEEDKQTRIYMDRYGIENVRGGSFAHSQLSEAELSVLRNMQLHAEQRCFNCGGKGHYARYCSSPRTEPGSNYNDNIEDVYAQQVITVSPITKSPNLDTATAADLIDLLAQQACNLLVEAPTTEPVTMKQQQTNVCTRCGRNSHTIDKCFAKTSIDGYKLPPMFPVSRRVRRG